MYEVEAVGINYTGVVAPVTLRAQISSGGVLYTLGRVRPPISGDTYPFIGRWTLDPGDFITMGILGATAGDRAVVYFVGRKFSTS
jgi:hypothetical protein